MSHEIRRTVLEQSLRAHAGHIGSALSIADLLAVLFGGAMNLPGAVNLPGTGTPEPPSNPELTSNPAEPADPERDRFVLSKGHAALGLYAALHSTGRLSDEQLASFYVDGSPIATHPEHVVPGIDFSTGSLGQGLSFGVGAALAARMQSSPRRVFVLLSDAECNEGAVWEAIMFAAHHKLGNVIALVDLNGQQALGYTREVLDLEPMSERWASFGWDVHDVDGHDADLLDEVIEQLKAAGGPHVLLARTTFGKGVSYMENAIPWHYRSMSAEQCQQALTELESVPA